MGKEASSEQEVIFQALFIAGIEPISSISQTLKKIYQKIELVN